MSHDDDKWHWQEGNKYAVEGIRTLLLLNGGAAVALLTFVGNSKDKAYPIGTALLCFGLGALLGGLVFVFAYLTQLFYGNKNWPVALRLHFFTYFLFICSALAFVAGLLSAWSKMPV